ncbi:MAG: phosphoserine transaminase [Firmicutes bacterium]|jgi:phosphoserine aminotransferase|nr:phosphoserine transaminase [Bacillota bacterium]
MNPKPTLKPENPFFSSGPCAKYPRYSLEALADAPLGRSHRSALGRSRLLQSIRMTGEILGIPKDYLVGIVPASDTGAVEMALWNLLGARAVDVLCFEAFGRGWAHDIEEQLKLKDLRVISADYGLLPDLSRLDFSRDLVFTWNGTTSGVKVPDGGFIPSDRQGLTICDATSAVFAMEIPWEKLDVVTFSWQKVLGGEAAHGMLVLSPRAVRRIETYTPPWPLPKIFRLKEGGKLLRSLFEGSTINTPSMLCNEDYLAALRWARSIGGLPALIRRSRDNLGVIAAFVAAHEWIDFLAADPAIRSNTSVCLTVELPPEKLQQLLRLLEEEQAAYDIASYRDAPPGLRFWCGATVEQSDLERALLWLEWAYREVIRAGDTTRG